MNLILAPGSTSVITHVFARDISDNNGTGKTGLVFGDITAYYVRAGGVLTALTMVDITTLGTWDADVISDKLGFKLLHDTNAPGLYEVHLPANILASGANQVTVQLRAADMAPVVIEIQLVGVPLAATQGAITWGQQKIVANVAGEGALDISNAAGIGQYNHGATGMSNYGTAYGMSNEGIDGGQRNYSGTYYGMLNSGGEADLAGNITGNITGSLSGSVGSVATGGITAASIAADAIGASELAADAVAEIADAVWNETSTGHTTAGYAGAQLWTDVDAILADTGTDGVVLKAAGLAADAAAEIADAVWDEALADHVVAGSAGEELGNLGETSITVVSPVDTNGDVEIDRGYDYYDTDGRALSWTDDATITWPNLTGATASFIVGEFLTEAGVITNPTGPATIKVELSAADTELLPLGVRPFRIECTLANTHLILQIRGKITVRD